MQIDTLIPDDKLAKEGKWIEFPDADGVAFKLAYFGNSAYQIKLRKLAAKVRKHRGKISEEDQIDLEAESLIGTVLLDWRGLDDGYDEEGKDKPLPYSEQEARRILKTCQPIRAFINNEVGSLQNFQTGGSEGSDGASAELKSVPRVDA